MRFALAVAAVFAFTIPSVAGQSEAQSCASGLDASGQMIFNAVLPQVSPGADLKGVLTATTKSLVKSGQIGRGDAKPAAMAAGECLKLAMQ
jgi:hypothetical protein